MFSKEELIKLCRIYDVELEEIGDVIDTSHGDEDLRYNYSIDDQYFL